MESKMLITQFFENQEIFITGGSGFIGKALIEKLLRECPNLGKIYVLLRSKKNRNCHERLKDILNTSLFNRVRMEQPKAMNKVQAIAGDCSELQLGISADDLKLLKNVNIVYHSAANVRFDDDLKYAILLNTRGTHELVKIATTFANIKVFVHVSTTYCYPHEYVVEERVYDTFADWRNTIQLAETYDVEILNTLTPKYTDNQPNTYTFTKGLGEQIINDYNKILPMVILRPSIVVSSIVEPFPGWVDNFNGPLGMLVGCGIGICRTSYADPNHIADFVPIDIVVRTIIIATYVRATEEPPNELPVFNCATAAIRPITLQQLLDIGTKLIRKNPFEKTLWVPGGGVTLCPAMNWLKVFFMQIVMSSFVDLGFLLTNQKPFLMKLQRRIYAANMALHYFMSTMFEFKIDRLAALDDKVPAAETDKFRFLHYKNLDYDDFFAAGIRGAKQYLLKESPQTSKAAHTRMFFYKTIHYSLQILIVFLIVRFFAKLLANNMYAYIMQWP